MERIQDARILIVVDNYDLLEVLQKILREEGFINIMTTCNCENAKDEDQDRLFGLGSDDYLTKPFLTEELILRLQLILKRTYFSSYKNTLNNTKLLLPPCEINFSDGSISSPTGTFTMTAKEMATMGMKMH